jgi:hypothetical protein
MISLILTSAGAVARQAAVKAAQAASRREKDGFMNVGFQFARFRIPAVA